MGRRREERAISVAVWVLIGVAAWLVAAVTVAVVIGRVVARRDRQVPGLRQVRPCTDVVEREPPEGGVPVLRPGRRR